MERYLKQFCAVSVAGGDLAQFNVAFPGTGARTFCVTRCASGVTVSVGVVSCVLDRPAVVRGVKAHSGYFSPLGGTGRVGAVIAEQGSRVLLVASCLPPVLPCSGLHDLYGRGWNPLKLNSILGFSR